MCLQKPTADRTTWTVISQDASLPPSPPKSPVVDYFSHHSPGDSDSSSPYNARTPLASGYRTARDSTYSPKTSWTNLAGLFNSSVLSLRSQGTSHAGSPESGENSPAAMRSPAAREGSSPEVRRVPSSIRPSLAREHSKLREGIVPIVKFGSTTSVSAGSEIGRASCRERGS